MQQANSLEDSANSTKIKTLLHTKITTPWEGLAKQDGLVSSAVFAEVGSALTYTRALCSHCVLEDPPSLLQVPAIGGSLRLIQRLRREWRGGVSFRVTLKFRLLLGFQRDASYLPWPRLCGPRWPRGGSSGAPPDL